MKRDLIKSLSLLFFLMLTGVPDANAEWVEWGNPVCTENGRQSAPRIVPDGSGGAIIAWLDERSAEPDIYAQRIGPYGQLIWDSGGVAVCTEKDRQYQIQAISDDAGGAIIAWDDWRHGAYASIYVQRIDGSGYALWEQGGIPVCPVAAMQHQAGLTTDGADGAIVVWEDLRDGSRKAYAQRIDSRGDRIWSHEGIEVSDAALRSQFLQAIPDSTGGAVIVWVTTHSGGWTLYAQGIDAVGSLRWSGDVMIASGAQEIEGFSSTSGAAGGAIIAWDEVGEDYPLHRLHAQRIDADGVARWSTGGVPIIASSTQLSRPRITRDSAGGAVMVWEAMDGSAYWQYGQRIDGDGAKVWGEDGVEVCYTATTQYGLTLLSDGAGGAMSVWSEKRDPAQHDLIAQRITGSGEHKWTITGLRVCSAGGDQTSPALIPDGEGGAIISWQDGRDGYYHDIYALRIGADGGIPPVTKLESYSAYGVGYDIVIEWKLAQAGKDMIFSVYRAVEPETAFQEISDSMIIGSGLSYAFVDWKREPSTTYRYRVFVSDDEGTRILFETDPVITPPMPLTLYQNFPNPFNPQTTIYYYLPEPGRVSLEVYDVSGKRITRVMYGWRERGHHGEPWDGCDADGDPLPTGVYLCRLRSWMGTRERKMIIVR